MVNASLNWASIVGIVLAVGGALLYFMRSFKPALARDYDVFFAAIGLLCGGILFFQGWRLDPILQFGQFLLAGTTVFFAYESVRLRGVATEQARRSAYFDDEPAPAVEARHRECVVVGTTDYDRFDEPQPLRRRFSGGGDNFDDAPQEDLYRPRRTSRAAIPEQAASRRSSGDDEAQQSWDSPDGDERSRRMARFRAGEARDERRSDFGERRSQRDDQRRGSRPTGRSAASGVDGATSERGTTAARPARPEAEDAAFSTRRATGGSRPVATRPEPSRPETDRFSPAVQSPPGLKTAARPAPRSSRPAVPAHARGITAPVSTTEPAPNAPADPAGRRPGGLQWPGGTDRRCLARPPASRIPLSVATVVCWPW